MENYFLAGPEGLLGDELDVEELEDPVEPEDFESEAGLLSPDLAGVDFDSPPPSDFPPLLFL
jgi:hypothetical protein